MKTRTTTAMALLLVLGLGAAPDAPQSQVQPEAVDAPTIPTPAVVEDHGEDRVELRGLWLCRW